MSETQLTAPPPPAEPYTGRPIGADTCNALITEAPLTVAELHKLREHFAALAEMCVISGPRFGASRQAAVDFHNRCVRRLRGIRDEVKRRAMEEEDGLMEIK
jgi:hypothetical protein